MGFRESLCKRVIFVRPGSRQRTPGVRFWNIMPSKNTQRPSGMSRPGSRKKRGKRKEVPCSTYRKN